MYLTRINPKTNLIDISDTQDGLLAIKEFAAIINNKEFGIECMTCIALSVDYASPMRKYPSLERPFASMRFVTGNAKAFAFNNDLVMAACDVYESLQFNADLEEIRIIKQMRLEKLAELKDATTTQDRVLLLSEIDKIKKMENKYTEEDEARFIDESEAKKNNYNLSRLENKIKNKNTFYHVRRKKQGTKSEEQSIESARINTGSN